MQSSGLSTRLIRPADVDQKCKVVLHKCSSQVTVRLCVTVVQMMTMVVALLSYVVVNQKGSNGL